MPNWKKIALSGSSPAFSSVNVDNSVVAQDINANTITGSLDFSNLVSIPNYTLLTNNMVQDQVVIATGYNSVTSSADIFLNTLNVDSSITTSTFTGSLLRLDENGTGLRMTNVGAFDNSSGNFRIFSNGDLILSTNGQTGTAVTFNQTSKDANFIGAVTASHFVGDGSGLTNLPQGDVGEIATVSDTFTNTTTKSVTHGFGTKNVIVSIYDNNDQLLIPSSITTTTSQSIDIVFDTASSGRVVVAKGGHIVTSQTYRSEVSSSTSYTLEHNLNEDFPLVQAYSSSKKQIIPGDVESIDENSILVSFDSNFNGTIVIKK